MFAILALVPTRVWSVALSTDSDDLRRLQLINTHDLVIIDVRAPNAFAKGHIQGALNAPTGDLGPTTLPKDGRVIVYCPETSCPLGETAAAKLRGLGYTNVSVLQGGLAEWIRKGYPVANAANTASPKPKPGRISAETVKDKLEASKLLAIDVRPDIEFSAGHLPGARNIPLESLTAELLSLPKDKDILVYDRQASRTRKAAEQLLDSGYRVYELPGGIAGWVKKKYPLEVK